MPQIHQKVYNSAQVSLSVLVAPYVMQHLDLTDLGYLLCATIHNLKD